MSLFQITHQLKKQQSALQGNRPTINFMSYMLIIQAALKPHTAQNPAPYPPSDTPKQGHSLC